MNIKSKLNNLYEEVVENLSSIKELPEGFLPHTVFVEGEDCRGDTTYTKYQITDIDPVNRNCMISDKENNFTEEISLNDINIDWLVILWNRYEELIHPKKPLISHQKELSVFLYPVERFDRNASDEEIINDYENDEGQDPCVEKYTPDEFAAKANDGDFLNQNMYIRFINY